MSTVRAVLKIGGSFLSAPSELSRVLDAILSCSIRDSIIVTLGSGKLHGALDDYLSPALQPSAAASFETALLARDCVAIYAVSTRREFRLLDSLHQLDDIITGGFIPILRQSAFVRSNWPYSSSPDLSTDSVSAFLAGLLGTKRVVLLKRVDGIYRTFPPRPGDMPIRHIFSAELRRNPTTCVDALLPVLLERFGLRCLVTSGLEPANVERSLTEEDCPGTWIEPSANLSSQDFAGEMSR